MFVKLLDKELNKITDFYVSKGALSSPSVLRARLNVEC